MHDGSLAAEPGGSALIDADPRVAAALPQALHDRPAATLLVDLGAGVVVFANHLATELAPGLDLPCPLGAWSQAAGLRTIDGTELEEGRYVLADVAAGVPARGVQVTAARASDVSGAREAMWLIGVPLTDAPPPLAQQALVILLPRGDDESDRVLQDLSEDLHARAAMASELSFTISDPNQPDDPLIWVNPAFERVTGYAAADVLGTNCRFLQGPATDRSTVARIRDALDRGVTVADTLLNYRKDGTPFWNQVVISPVVDADGKVTHHVGIQADVTERVDAQMAREAALDAARASTLRLHLLGEVSQTVAQHLDYTEAVRALADVVVPRLAAWGFVAVTDDQGRFDRLHVAARDPEHAADATALEQEDVSWLTRSPAVRRVLSGDPGEVAEPFDVDVDGLPARTTPRQLELLGRLGLGSALVVPLVARDRVLGVLCLVHEDRGGFDRDVVVTAAHVSHRAGLALDNVRLYQREREAALTLQRSLLPDLPAVPGLDVAASYVPALHRSEVGGDWYDVLALPDGSVGLAVGDVVGHDLRAAASMGQLRSVLRSYAWAGGSAGEVITRLDELVRGLEMADIATCVYLRLEGGVLRYSRAGHPSPMIRDADGTVRLLEGGLSTPVGVTTVTSGVGEDQTELPMGSILVLYSDGLVERRDRTLRDGMAELARMLGDLPAESTATQVRDHLVGRMVGDRQEDDLCVLVVRRVA